MQEEKKNFRNFFEKLRHFRELNKNDYAEW
jgi:hypothetical protein